MQPGQILVANHDGVYIIRMVGDVRLTLCVSFDQFIHDMFSQDNFSSIVFDLTEAVAVDSTTLGLMAKISLQAQQKRSVRPLILSDSPGINRILDCMGFTEIFDIVSDYRLPGVGVPAAVRDTQALDCEPVTEDEARQRILEAHRILMQLNEKNRATFQDLVKTLEEG